MIFDKVQKCAEELGLSIRELERRAGLENGTISKWRTCNPRLNNIAAVAKELKRPIEFFLEDEGR